MSWIGRLFKKKKPPELVPEPTTRETVWWQGEPMARAEREITSRLGWQSIIYLSALIVGAVLRDRSMALGDEVTLVLVGGVVWVSTWNRRFNRLLDERRVKVIGDQRIRNRIMEECDRSACDQPFVVD